ncbi:hypothetical protein ACT3UA_11485 [Glutamicibacter sp. 363]|uniref:hypothetical protein n=1 Tax=unclassified Glutamicibacter TaxID=2627139 RepID=UPI004034BF06
MSTLYRPICQGKTQKTTAEAIYNYVVANLERWLASKGEVDVTFRLDDSAVAIRFQQGGLRGNVLPVIAPKNPASKAEPALAGSLADGIGEDFKAIDGSLARRVDAVRALKVVIGRARRWHNA